MLLELELSGNTSHFESQTCTFDWPDGSNPDPEITISDPPKPAENIEIQEVAYDILWVVFNTNTKV